MVFCNYVVASAVNPDAVVKGATDYVAFYGGLAYAPRDVSPSPNVDASVNVGNNVVCYCAVVSSYGDSAGKQLWR